MSVFYDCFDTIHNNNDSNDTQYDDEYPADSNEWKVAIKN